jgi:hypothetical protein
LADFIAGNEFLRTLVREVFVAPFIWILDKSPLRQYTEYWPKEPQGTFGLALASALTGY